MILTDFSARLDALRPRWAALLLIVVCLGLYLPGFASLPPMDRDEPRFAQASKQMLETGDFVAIRYQDEARNKKPVGIYWLQAAAVSLGERVGVDDARRSIWLYRLPSLLGAITAVLATYWAALAISTRRAALVGALLFASTVILTVEAHLAKTDAMVTATVVLAMGCLARLYLAARHGPPRADWRLPALFWTAIGVGILIKGPITPMVPAFAILVLAIKDRSAAWLRTLRPGLGLLWVLCLVLPWFTLILLRTHGSFLADSVGHDMLGKVANSQESHGAPPGTYLAAFWVTAWPLAPFVALGAARAWSLRREPRFAFLLAWIVPTWLLFEVVSTKLPHYVMPAYPGLAILAAAILVEEVRTKPRSLWASAVVLALLALMPIALLVVLQIGEARLWTVLRAAVTVGGVVSAAMMAGCVVVAAVRLRRGCILDAAVAAAGAALVMNLFVLGLLLSPRVSDLIAVSQRLDAAGRSTIDPACANPAFASAGDHEPSLVFFVGTNLRLTGAQGAAAFMSEGDCRVAYVESRLEPPFTAALGTVPEVRLAERVSGTAINGGKRLDIGVYVRQRERP